MLAGLGALVLAGTGMGYGIHQYVARPQHLAIRLTNATAQTDADTACTKAGGPWTSNFTVVAAYPSTAGAVQSWVQTRMPTHPVYSALSPAAAAAPVAVCYLAGSFTGIPAAPGSNDIYSALIVTVDESSGAITLNAAGQSSSWTFGPPPAD